jgi:hypothetical protein
MTKRKRTIRVITKLPNSEQSYKGKVTHIYSLNRKKTPQYMRLKTQVLAWDKHTNMAGLNRLKGSQPSPPDNWISNGIYGETYLN